MEGDKSCKSIVDRTKLTYVDREAGDEKDMYIMREAEYVRTQVTSE